MTNYNTKYKFTEKQLDAMRERHRCGETLIAIAKGVGCGRETLRRRLYPDAQSRPKYPAKGIGRVSLSEFEANVRKLQEQIPPDTRDLTARLCGDPLPGRSHLDKVREASA